jgi:sorbitol-specific phosphotransferase system component IIC
MTSSTASIGSSPSVSSKKSLIGHGIVALVTLALVGSAFAKFAGASAMVENFAKFHLSGFLIPVGVIEVVSVLLFAVPKTASLGTLLLTGYFGGAVVAHLAGNDVVGVFPALILGALAWTANGLRNPNMFESLTR